MNLKNKNHKIISLVSLVFILVFIFLLSQTNISKTVAQTSTSTLSGYAWSETIGWISMASSTDYGVGIDGNSLVGYAWSDAVGWIKFGGLVGGTVIGGDTGVTWTARDSVRNWRDLASSADGKKLAAVVENGKIYTSTDSGVTWTPRDSDRRWYAIASSADGTKLAAVVYAGQIYTSTDSGATWTARNSTTRKWSYIASDSSGTKLFALEQLNGEGSSYGQIYRSTDGGITWTAVTTGQMYWSSIASSADGMKLVATVYYGGGIYTSVDGGNTWVKKTNAGDRYWGGAVSSLDGTKLVATSDGGGKGIYMSTDSGSTWTNLASNITNGTNINWSRVSMSDDGKNLAAVSYYYDGSQNIYTSTDGGATWSTRTPPGTSRQHYWQDSVSSLDGRKLAIVELGGQIYTSTPEPISVTDAQLNGVNVTGWARACAGTIGGDCNSATRSDGWDGWISLAGPGYGVKIDGTYTYAWGSDVVGWIDFSRVTAVESDTCPNVNGDQPSVPANMEKNLDTGDCLCKNKAVPNTNCEFCSGDQEFDDKNECAPKADKCSNIPETQADVPLHTATSTGPTGVECHCKNGADDPLNCLLDTPLDDLPQDYDLPDPSNSPLDVGARLVPYIVGPTEQCSISWKVFDVATPPNDLWCYVYRGTDKYNDSNLVKDGYQVNPGSDYQIKCSGADGTPFASSKILKCLLNPNIKEI